MRYFIFEKIRLDSFGSPFRNVNSGVNEDEDPVNQERFEKGMKIYLDQYRSSLYSSKKLKALKKIHGPRMQSGPSLPSHFLVPSLFCTFTPDQAQYF